MSQISKTFSNNCILYWFCSRVEPPSETQRVEVFLKGLKNILKKPLVDHLRDKLRRTEFMTYSEISDAEQVNIKLCIKYSWNEILENDKPIVKMSTTQTCEGCGGNGYGKDRCWINNQSLRPTPKACQPAPPTTAKSPNPPSTVTTCSKFIRAGHREERRWMAHPELRRLSC